MSVPQKIQKAAAAVKESCAYYGHGFVEQLAYDTGPEAEAIRQRERAKRDAERAREDAIKTAQAQQQMQALALQNYSQTVVPYIRFEAYKVLCRAHSRLGALQPYAVEQVPAQYVCKGGCVLTNVYVQRAELTPVQDGTLRLVGDVFQQEMEQDLRAGLVEGVNVASMDGRTPLLFVDEVVVSGSYYIITIGVAWDAAMIKRYWSRRMSRPMPTAPADPFDDVL